MRLIGIVVAVLFWVLASPVLAQTQGNAVGDLVSKCGANTPVFGTGTAGTDAVLSCSGTVPVGQGGTSLIAITAHAFMIGNGTSAPNLLTPSATSGIPVVSGGASADPAYGTAAIAGGGTGAVTATAAFANLAPTPTRAGDILYWNGSAWVTLAGNNSGTQVLEETSSGVPSWATVSGTGTVVSVAVSGELGQTGTCSSTSAVSCTINTASPDDNIAINAATEVSQFNGTNAVTTSGYVLDQWEVTFSGTMTLSSQQSTDAPPGFAHSLKVTVTGAEASLGTSDYVTIFQPIEGTRIARLAFGSASASPVSVGEFVRAHRTGTYSIYLQTCTGTRNYVASFTISAADTWQWVALPNIAGDTSGTWPSDTSCGMRIGIGMAVGTSLQTSAATWTTSTTPGLLGVTSTTNGVAATTDYMETTGLVVLGGTNLPSSARAPLVMRPFADELIKCQWYYDTLSFIIRSDAVTEHYVWLPWLVKKRTVPSVSLTNLAYSNGSAGVIQNASVDGAELAFSSSAIGGYMTGTAIADARL